jgi:hypothetical protein
LADYTIRQGDSFGQIRARLLDDAKQPIDLSGGSAELRLYQRETIIHRTATIETPQTDPSVQGWVHYDWVLDETDQFDGLFDGLFWFVRGDGKEGTAPNRGYFIVSFERSPETPT